MGKGRKPESTIGSLKRDLDDARVQLRHLRAENQRLRDQLARERDRVRVTGGHGNGG